MRVKLTIILSYLILMHFTACNKRGDQPELQYTITHLKKSDQPILKIDLNLEADQSGVTHLIYQDNAWGQDSLFNAINDIKVLSKGKLSIDRDSSRIIIEHDPSLKRLELSYSLVQDYSGPTTSRKVYRPIIQPNYFQVFGHNLFVLPKNVVEKESFNLSLTWNVPEPDFELQNSFGNHQKFQLINNLSQDALNSSVFVGGDFRIHDIDLEGNQVAFAIRDDWEVFDDSTMVELLKATISAQREFWDDHSQPYFSVTMIPIYEQYGSSWQGTGLTNSFALAASNNEHLEVQGLVHLLNHELQHNWIGLKIKNENEEEQYWFSEGFTDYYTIKNITVNRIAGLDANYFIEEFNSKLKNLFSSPVVSAPNSEINYDNFWKDRSYSELPYLRGAVFAFILDQKIRKASNGLNSLDDVMKQFYKNPEEKLSHVYFLKTVNSFLDYDIEPFFNRHIVEGVPFEMRKIFEDLGLEYQPTASVFYLGVKKEENDERSILHVDPESNAYEAGLRSGDRILSQSVTYGRPDLEASYVVKRGNAELDIKFYPSREMEVPQLLNSAQNINELGLASD